MSWNITISPRLSLQVRARSSQNAIAIVELLGYNVIILVSEVGRALVVAKKR